ncbi:MAG TPA: HoxN/HupN/NixA family nickel/cobalt transporter [Stellaceae bacterium]|nr:HoxN/HupN/NixA family nickel/cobalt transporter [Stellaceae bacterium]
MPSCNLAPLLRRLFDDREAQVRAKITGLYAGLVAANLAAWAWALLAFRGNPVLLGTALLAYGFGLRHAVDADHIAAIDNVTRKLMQEGKRPIAVGFFFALGHSTVVVAAALAVALTASTLQNRHPGLIAAGGAIGTAVSALFLFGIALINALVMAGVIRLFRRVRRGGHYRDDELDVFLARRGVMGRVYRRLFRLIARSWHMYPLGFLFGLGFETASEVGLLGISAAEATRGLSAWSILVFPALFTAGMSLVDTTDGVVMLGAYGWAFVNPVRKLYYNLTITGMSVAVAVAVGGIEALGLVAGQFGLTGGVWTAIDAANDNFGAIGYAVVGIFVASWIVSFIVYRVMGYDKLGARGGD